MVQSSTQQKRQQHVIALCTKRPIDGATRLTIWGGRTIHFPGDSNEITRRWIGVCVYTCNVISIENIYLPPCDAILYVLTCDILRPTSDSLAGWLCTGDEWSERMRQNNNKSTSPLVSSVIFPFSHAKRALYSRTWTTAKRRRTTKKIFFL